MKFVAPLLLVALAASLGAQPPVPRPPEERIAELERQVANLRERLDYVECKSFTPEQDERTRPAWRLMRL